MLLTLVALAIPLTLIWLAVVVVRLRRRVATLEARMAGAAQPLPADAPRLPPVAAPADPVAPAPQEAAPAAETAAAAAAAPPAAPAALSPWDRARPGPAAAPPGPAIAAGPLSPPTPGAAPSQDQPLVIRKDRLAALGAWISAHWVYVISAASLALAGVFLVQYGAENGLLPPGARVLAGALLGAGLIGAGEWMRRRLGDRGNVVWLPQVFSGAGIVAIFAAVVAARLLYGLIGTEMAFALQLAVAALSVLLGWLNGPLLVATGLIGAAISPLILGGTTAPAPWLYGHYALIACVALASDGVRRWAWISVLGLGLAFLGGALMYRAGAGEMPALLFALALPVLATALPVLRLVPDHAGPTVLQALAAPPPRQWPIFPTRLAFGTLLLASLALVGAATWAQPAGLAALVALTGLALIFLLWADRAEGLADLPLLPAAGLVLAVLLIGLQDAPLLAELQEAAQSRRPPETDPPLTIAWIMAMAAAVSLGFLKSALSRGPLPRLMALAAALVAPLVAAAAELLWHPADHLGAFGWGMQLILLAGLMTFMALSLARADGDDRRRSAHAALSALTLIALALFVLTTQTALTLALCLLVLAAAWLDRRFDLPDMGLFIQAASAVIGYRLLIDPGLGWAMQAPLAPVLLVFGAALAAGPAALRLLSGRTRPLTRGVLETAVGAQATVLANVLFARALAPERAEDSFSHWGLALHALPWLVLALSQVWRARLGGPRALVWLRRALALLAGLIATTGLSMSLTLANPLVADPVWQGGRILGVPPLNSLLLAYGLPGLLLLLVAARSGARRPAAGPGSAPILAPGLSRLSRLAGGGLVLLYLFLSIRQFWQGTDIRLTRGLTQPELYSYTLAMLTIGAVLLWRAIGQRSAPLRRLAMAVIALTVAKVFLIDISGLSGLTRVASFLGLGLSLAGLAWLNRWAGREAAGPPPPQAGPPPPA